MNNDYPKGSEWRKWDLQVQTRLDQNYSCLGPSSLTAEQLSSIKKATSLTDVEISSQEKSVSPEKYAKLFVAYVTLFTDISVIGVTNHNTGKELDHLIAEAKLTNGKLTVIPGVEVSSTQGIHILCLFDPEKKWKTDWEKSIEHFLTEIGVTGTGFNEHGQPSSASKSAQEILEIVDKKGGICIFAHIGTDNGLFKQSSTANGGTAHSSIYTHSLCNIVQIPHNGGLTAGTQNIIEGKDPQYGSKKVTKIKCSDSRKLTEIGSNFTWIKADPTFEGLVQIIFEPENRVSIQSGSPNPLKSSQVISEFQIKAAILEPELSFKETALILNQGLVAVAGGKGSGKTALVDLIANMYDGRAFCEDKNSFVRRISDSVNPKDLDTTIKLDSGEEFTKKIQQDSFVEDASIVYVAQGELEKHVEDPAHLEKYINGLIFNSIAIKDSELLFDYQNLTTEIADINGEIKMANKKIFDLEKATDPKIYSDLEKESKKLGVELKDAEKQIDELKKNQSAEKIKEAEEKQKQLTELRDKKDQLTNLGVALKEAIKFSEEGLVDFNEQVEKINALAIKLKIKREFKPLKYEDVEGLQSLIETAHTETRKVVGEIGKFQRELEAVEKGVKEHTKTLDKKKELEKAIKVVADNLKVIDQQKTLLGKEKEKRAEKFKKLIDTKLEEQKKYVAIIASFGQNKNDILSDLEFSAELIFDRVTFLRAISEIADNRKMKVEPFEDSDSDTFAFYESVKELMLAPEAGKVTDFLLKNDTLLEKLLASQKRSVTITNLTIYQTLFGDYFSVVPAVKYKKTKLSKLSLGQKATVLIKIYLAEGEKPILIDSHDDHLDNEFIMDELVKAIRQAKQYRQVIVVSNNGNVVVNSDAEQVIIANRDNSGEISYISGSLENAGLREKLLNVLEGGREAFSKRQQKYRLNV